MDSPREFVESYLKAWNAQDATGVAGHLGQTGTYVDGSSQEKLTGTTLVEHLEEYFGNEEYRYEIVGDVLSNGRTIAFQYRVTPRDTASKASGWGGAEFIELDGEFARRISDYYRAPANDAIAPRGQRYAKSGLGPDAMATLLTDLERAMDVDRAFLDPDLSLPRLAATLGCSVNHLSQAINAGHRLSFFDYINGYRVAEAARILRRKDGSFPAILDVALSVGFNSTSTFYTAFKKAMGETPARYRRSQLSL